MGRPITGAVDSLLDAIIKSHRLFFFDWPLRDSFKLVSASRGEPAMCVLSAVSSNERPIVRSFLRGQPGEVARTGQTPQGAKPGQRRCMPGPIMT
jgi:hypothetical protein